MSKTDEPAGALDKIGFLEGLGCQVIWGCMYVYWKLLGTQSALLILACRMAWAAVFVILLCRLVMKTRFGYMLKDPRAVRTFLASGLITTANWGIFIWGVNSSHVLECSIGYYLCPLVNIFFGVVIFKERMTLMQKIATALAAVGVTYFIATNGGAIWVSFGLALTFAAYGAVKKKAGFPALPGMAVESLLTGAIGASALIMGFFLPEIWEILPATPGPMAVTDQTTILVLLFVAGILTAVPLLMYSAAANRIPLTIIGFLQYVSPTMALLLAVAFFDEAFTLAHGICFALIWIGIAAVAAEGMLASRKAKEAK